MYLSGRLSRVAAELSDLSEILALFIVDPCMESLFFPSPFYTVLDMYGMIVPNFPPCHPTAQVQRGPKLQ